MTHDRQTETAAEKLGALASPHRLAVFRALVRAGQSGLAAGNIAERLNMPSSTLSFHLSHLRQAGLILDRRVGRSIIYRADYAAMRGLIEYLLEECCADESCGPMCETKEGT